MLNFGVLKLAQAFLKICQRELSKTAQSGTLPTILRVGDIAVNLKSTSIVVTRFAAFVYFSCLNNLNPLAVNVPNVGNLLAQMAV